MATTKKTAVKKTTAKKTATTKRPAARSAAKTGAKSGAKHGSDPSHYTRPELRDRLKNEILAGDKGGHPGQWSARKAQLLAHEYEAAGGGYVGGKAPAQQHLDQWTHEAWTTADGKPAQRGEATARYLPKKAWEELSPAERRATDKKKRAGSKTGRQFVANTERAATARRHATEHENGTPAAAGRPAAKHAAAKQPAAKQSAAQRPTAKPPAAKRSATKRPAATGTAAKGAAARRTAAKRPRR